MKALIRYRISRLIVFLVALHTLDVSVDLDHLTNSIGWADVERYDDIDSMSEFILEKLFNDDNLIKEGKTDDRPRSKNHLSHITLKTFTTDYEKGITVHAAGEQPNNFCPSLRNTRFLFEDHSNPDYNPPDSQS
ncbi:hypothetical protein A4D02_04815 [Niastella koreensis]|uniref:Uncharacterized protein n=2 Tax=Niastella koreensis TaxID=354356 RepID=G8T7P9_NIAKG|nr:hypothetical protein [Niastella koreensis]AEW03343.1 hypothetical protein Niako_7123 [Niastella koreensis GR20-10]OQP55628.1 hypothetical protein A4D02_04815 [Niastella koreensis]